MIAWPNPPKTFQEAIDLAVRLEQVKPFCKPKATTQRQLDAPMRLRRCGRGHSKYSYQPLQGNVKEISCANQRPLNVIVTTDKKERRRRENLYFYYGRPGHSIAECCEKKSNEAGKSQAQ